MRLTENFRHKAEMNMLIVSALRPEKRLEMNLVHRVFCERHVNNAEKFHACSYVVEMGMTRVSVREKIKP